MAADRRRRSRMEGKKRLSTAATAAWCLLAVLLLSGQPVQPVAGMSEFCRCYKACYAECRKDSGPYPCNFGCLQHCFNNDDQLPPPARPKSAADCDRICQSKSICGVMSTTATVAVAGDAQACLVDCRNSIGHSAPLKDAGQVN